MACRDYPYPNTERVGATLRKMLAEGLVGRRALNGVWMWRKKR